MTRYRIIPVLLLRQGGLYKTVGFKDPKYIGDPMNAVKIFNEKEVDELIFLDIEATQEKREPDYKMLNDIASECFMPLCYGGGIHNLEQIERILKIGVEKVAINTDLIRNPKFVQAAVKRFGGSTIVASIDFRHDIFGHTKAYICSGAVSAGLSAKELARRAEDLGVGEVFLNSIDRDGTMKGYDLDTIKDVASVLSVPLVPCGGCASLQDLHKIIHEAKVSAAAAGSFFVFVGRHRAVLITYPGQELLKTLVFQ